MFGGFCVWGLEHGWTQGLDFEVWLCRFGLWRGVTRRVLRTVYFKMEVCRIGLECRLVVLESR